MIKRHYASVAQKKLYENRPKFDISKAKDWPQFEEQMSNSSFDVIADGVKNILGTAKDKYNIPEVEKHHAILSKSMYVNLTSYLKQRGMDANVTDTLAVWLDKVREIIVVKRGFMELVKELLQTKGAYGTDTQMSIVHKCKDL